MKIDENNAYLGENRFVIQEKLREIIEKHAEKLLISGNPILASCVHLSINDGYSAVIKMIRGNYIYQAYLLAKFYKINYLLDYLKRIFLNKIMKNDILENDCKDIVKSYPYSQQIFNYYISNKEKIENLSKQVKLFNFY